MICELQTAAVDVLANSDSAASLLVSDFSRKFRTLLIVKPLRVRNKEHRGIHFPFQKIISFIITCVTASVIHFSFDLCTLPHVWSFRRKQMQAYGALEQQSVCADFPLIHKHRMQNGFLRQPVYLDLDVCVCTS